MTEALNTTRQPPSQANQAFIECWNEILTPKWIRFRHLLSGNGQIHSDLAAEHMEFRAGERVLDVGCGFGENCLEIAGAVGAAGEVVGLDPTEAFLEIAERERAAAGAENVRYELGDIESHPLPADHFDVAFSRFGIMYCSSPVRGLRAIHAALRPGGRVYAIVWCRLADNPCWCDAEEIALELLPPPGDEAKTCGPGPFSMGDAETDRRVMEAAGFANIELTRIAADVCLGTTLEEALDYQLSVGPAGYVIREAGEAGTRAAPRIRERLAAHLGRHRRADGSVWMPSSSWLISGAKPR